MNKRVKYILLICALLAVLFLSGCTKEGYVADKVSVLGVDISSMNREEAISALEGIELGKDEKAVITAGDEKIVLTAGDMGAKYNAEKTVDKIIEGSQGVFSGLFKKEYTPSIDIDKELLTEALTPFETEGEAKSARITEEGILITNGCSEKKLNREKLTEELEGFFGGASEEIVMEYTVSPVKGPSDGEILSELTGEFKEAEYIMDEEGNIAVTESSVGAVFDMDEALGVMSRHADEGEEFLIPCEVKIPRHTKKELEEALFRDNLGEYKTNFSSSSANRASNIGVCTGSINDVILMPGDVFSFNDTVGKRTVERGYKTAGAYVAGETVDQVGGGICQVSSTLYNAVLLSNLEITERRSHQMTVSYVPIGRDATVNWGTTDFKFKNNTEYPVKIAGTINGRNVTISIIGTETVENKKVEIVTNTVSVLEPPVETVEDIEKEVGYTKTEKGSRGYVVDATRVVYSNGVEVSREGLVRSKYNPKKTVVTVGTKIIEAPTDDAMPPGLMPPVENVTDSIS
ncbi:MAG: VanW family protein [Clostridia bacterium]|nr:VanW family protein [Clostridia bacterium]